ncbi:MAG: glycosyltransferase family 4 protein, partial [bacterium]|nr:glycosyltransferase family 4 protein [bacterium]
MRIAIVTAVLGRAGGMGRVAEEYANRLALRGHEVTVFSPALQAPKNGSIEKQNSSSCVIRFLNSYIRYGHAAWVPELSKLLNDFEVVHLQYPFIGAAGAIIKWRKKNPTRKLVITYHMDLIGRGFFRPFFYFYGKLTTSRVLRLADKIIVSSFDYADHSDFAKIFKGVRQKTAEIPFG